jgi:hypothetical protein
MNIQDEILNNAGKEMAREIDREVLWGMLVGIGWHRVMIDRLQDNNHAIDITIWLKEYCAGAYERNGRDFIFEDSKDATMFIMKWL